MQLDYSSPKKQPPVPQKENKTIEIIKKSEDITSRWISEEFRPEDKCRDKKREQEDQKSSALFY